MCRSIPYFQTQRWFKDIPSRLGVTPRQTSATRRISSLIPIYFSILILGLYYPKYNDLLCVLPRERVRYVRLCLLCGVLLCYFFTDRRASFLPGVVFNLDNRRTRP